MKLYPCPVCNNTLFHLVYESIDDIEYVGQALSIKCSQCTRGSISLPIDELSLKEADKYAIEEELDHELS